MLSPRLASVGCLLFALSAASCASWQKKAPEEVIEKKPELRDQRIGKIELHNPESKFVLVRLAQPMSVLPGSTLLSRSSEGTISVLKVSPERKNQLISADVVSGFPQNGDQVFITKATQEALLAAAKASSTGVPVYQAPSSLVPGVIPGMAPATMNHGGHDGLPIPGSIPTESELNTPLPPVQVTPPPFLSDQEISAPANLDEPLLPSE